jgi:hypothetical protein
MKHLLLALGILSMLVFYSCSASTSERYSSDERETDDSKTVADDEKTDTITEDFDFTPYRTKLDIPEKKLNFPTSSKSQDIWYDYEEIDTDTTSVKKIIDKVSGYRVLILTTDNLEEANNMQSETYFKKIQKQVYVIFDPPFYKVMVGDFTDYTNARNLSFKLNQMGYVEARVVNETVNIFGQ